MAAPRLTLVHRRDCALCEEMLAQLEALAGLVALPPIDLLDVDSDPLLRRRHGLDVPVLLLDGAVSVATASIGASSRGCCARAEARTPESSALLRRPNFPIIRRPLGSGAAARDSTSAVHAAHT